MIEKYKKELEGWGFDMPGFEGTWDALEELSLYNKKKTCQLEIFLCTLWWLC